MQSIKELSQETLSGTALVRIDLNTEDVWRLDRAVPTVKYLMERGAKVVVLSHKGRPKERITDGAPTGEEARELSLKGKAEILADRLGTPVSFFEKFNWQDIQKSIAHAPQGSVHMLENVRFLSGELENSGELAQRFAELGDYFVNEAFAVSHRAHASIFGIANILPAFAGLGFKEEIEVLGGVMKDPSHPLVVVLGGAKVSDKIGLLGFFRDKADAFLIGGAAANTLLEASGVDVGKSLTEDIDIEDFDVENLLSHTGLMIPTDWEVKGDKILDIGSDTIDAYVSKITDAATIIWNGPMGYTEDVDFRRGSERIAQAIAENETAYTIAGGGETVTFLRQERLAGDFDFISTGGGAMLQFLAGKTLPGIAVLGLGEEAGLG